MSEDDPLKWLDAQQGQTPAASSAATTGVSTDDPLKWLEAQPGYKPPPSPHTPAPEFTGGKPQQGKPDYAPLQGTGPGRFAEGVWANTGAPIVQAVKNVETQGVQGLPSVGDIWHGIADPMAAERAKALESLQPGLEYAGPKWYQAPLEAAGHALAGSIPIFGPMAAHAAERGAGGTQPVLDKYGNVIQPGTAPDPWGGAGEAAGALASAAAPTIAKGATQAAVATGKGVGTLASTLAKGIPDAEAAAQKLDQVGQAAGHIPINVNGPGQAALNAQKLADAGARMPTTMKKFLARVTDPTRPPVTFDEGRDFYTNAARPSSAEFQRISPPMGRFAGDFRTALHDSLTQAAEQAQTGLGDIYNSAVDEYRRAMKWRAIGQEAKEAIKAHAVKGAAGTLGGGALGLWLYNKLAGRAQGGSIVDRFPSREAMLASIRDPANRGGRRPS